jgi:hypothetical protein
MRTFRFLAAGIALVLALPCIAWVAVNVWLNVGLLPLVNERPERLHLDYTAAWMLWPGHVIVHGVALRTQGASDQWELRARSASADVDLQALRAHEIRLTNVRGHGARFHYRKRLADGEVMGPFAPPIAGFDNPPTRKPELLYPPGLKWAIALDGVEVQGVDEVWIEDYRYAGSAAVIGTAAVRAAGIDADLDLRLAGGAVFRGDTPLTEEMNGTISFELDGLAPKTAVTVATLDLFRIRADLTSKLGNFDFLDYYLGAAPWLRLDGTGKVAIAAGLYEGSLSEGSTFRIDTEDLAVSFLGYRVDGDAVISGEVAAGESGDLASHARLQYRKYAISEAGAPALVTGDGFTVDARTPDHTLDQPFTTMALAVDIPDSAVPDFARFDGYMPVGVGFQVLGGSGTVRGHMDAQIPSSVASGDLTLEGTGIRANFDGLLLDADIGIDAHLARGQLTERRYDFAGSNLSIRRFEMVDPAVPGPKLVGDAPWSAKIWAKRGLARIGADTYLDTDIAMTCTDSVPFVAIVARHKELAGWVQNLLSIHDVQGAARLSLGLDSVDVRGLEIRGGQFEVLLDWLRKRKDNHATLFARYGVLSLGVGVDGTERTIQVLNARRWHAERTGRAPAIVPIEEMAAEEKPRPRREERAARRAERQRGG